MVKALVATVSFWDHLPTGKATVQSAPLGALGSCDFSYSVALSFAWHGGTLGSNRNIYMFQIGFGKKHLLVLSREWENGGMGLLLIVVVDHSREFPTKHK